MQKKIRKNTKKCKIETPKKTREKHETIAIARTSSVAQKISYVCVRAEVVAGKEGKTKEVVKRIEK